ncbi:hypothetical protein O181_000232 [Austropuccinia psidii MF-1]|uniref:Uncharacterized protein n=1 Tax=Austropuccinia psidii MF-1 TaxID=1389203 RepID=A0A9Q3B8F7_9BASI|nr:hypothetical protein [Austropuccinia psidii MF-1]
MATNRWNKANFDAATLITSKVNCQVFNTIVNADISDKASSMWNKINELYSSKREMNKGRVWLNGRNPTTLVTYNNISTKPENSICIQACESSHRH